MMTEHDDTLADEVFAFIASLHGVRREFIQSANRSSAIAYARALAVLILRREGLTFEAVAVAINRSVGATAELAAGYADRTDIRDDLARWAVHTSAETFGNAIAPNPARWPADTPRPSCDEIRDAALELVGLPAGAWPPGSRSAAVHLARAAALPLLLGAGLVSKSAAGPAMGMGGHLRKGHAALELMHTPAGQLLTGALIDRLLNDSHQRTHPEPIADA